MIINQANLQALFTGFRTSFNRGLTGQVATYWPRIAMEVPSATSKEVYAWMGMFPKLREWLGDRVVQNLTTSKWEIENKAFELTISVPRDNIEDDQYGVFAPMFEEFGRSVRVFPDELIWALLPTGFASLCYDGQFFFDTDHPVLDANGVAQSVSNFGGGAGTAWYLVDTSRVIKPLVHQKRREFGFVAKDRPTDDNVFDKRDLVYGTDGRCNAGFGLWQLAYASKQTLDATNYAAARAAMGGMSGDHGKKLGLRPNLLIVPWSLEAAAKTVLEAEYMANGASNVWKGTAELLVVPYL